MYKTETRVRYSECGENGKLKLPALINYFQDTSSEQSEELGIGVDYLREKRRAWILTSWQIEVNRYPKVCETIEVSTWATGFKGVFGPRNFCMQTSDGEVLARANSLWVYMDMDNHCPTRPDAEEVEKYGAEPPLEMEYVSRKIKLPEEAVVDDTMPVRKYHIDTNSHVNNGQYVQMAMEFLPENFQIGQMRAEYKKAALLGDVIVPYVAQTDEVCTVLLCGEGKTTYAVVEFTKKKGNGEGTEQL